MKINIKALNFMRSDIIFKKQGNGFNKEFLPVKFITGII